MSRKNAAARISAADREANLALAAEINAMRRERFANAIAAEGAAGARQIAETQLRQASYLIMAAFNLTNDPNIPYQFSEEVCQQAKDATVELLALAQSPIGLRTARLAAGDVKFQRFLALAAGGKGAAQ